MGAGLDWLLARGKQMSCVVGLCCLVCLPPTPLRGTLPLTRASFEPKSCSISPTGNEWENGEWPVKMRSIYGAKMMRYCV